MSPNRLACVASVSVWFRSKERPRNGILGFGRARNETRVKKWKWGEGKGKGKEGNACRQTPRFWKPAFASERNAWLALLFICVRLQVVITLHQAIRLVQVQINSVEVYNQYQSLHERTPLMFAISDKHSGRQLNFLCCFLYLELGLSWVIHS